MKTRDERREAIRNAIGTVAGVVSSVRSSNAPAPIMNQKPKTDYTPVIIGGIVSIAVALIFASRK